ncbi:toxin-antitoxin system, antitoxin component, Xre family protein [Acidobacteria bacterium ACD]|nr:MAG: toxin-antitoxin system, antitoxin component, Xre family protein [Acidobacteriota bacterium]MCE7958531.1 toxin-antitoxin system, antitoxin component, Xre family protein [Acidobacteria bacterium ACB2]MDL1951483.1 toxin-antitoxin system, antitoxin component, Xre family protein [Acidobacteria bacterium ACD]
MPSRNRNDDTLLEKLRALSPEKLAEVEELVEFLLKQDEDHQLRRAAMRMSEPALRQAWDNPEDADYDLL